MHKMAKKQVCHKNLLLSQKGGNKISSIRAQQSMLQTQGTPQRAQKSDPKYSRRTDNELDYKLKNK